MSKDDERKVQTSETLDPGGDDSAADRAPGAQGTTSRERGHRRWQHRCQKSSYEIGPTAILRPMEFCLAGEQYAWSGLDDRAGHAFPHLCEMLSTDGGTPLSRFVGLFPRIQAAHANTTSTVLVAAPLPRVIFASVQKEPATAALGRRALLHPVHRSSSQKVSSQHQLDRTRERPIQVSQPTLPRFPLPRQMTICCDETLVASRLRQQILHHLYPTLRKSGC